VWEEGFDAALASPGAVFSLVNKVGVDEANRRIEENRRENKRLIALNKQRQACGKWDLGIGCSAVQRAVVCHCGHHLYLLSPMFNYVTVNVMAVGCEDAEPQRCAGHLVAQEEKDQLVRLQVEAEERMRRQAWKETFENIDQEKVHNHHNHRPSPVGANCPGSNSGFTLSTSFHYSPEQCASAYM
jgi:hypothetical protein